MSKKYRKNIPKAVKDRLWDITFGPEAGQGACWVCEATINSKRFEAGHIDSVFNGGKDTIDNLRCICSTCNKSMSIENMDIFKKIYFPGKYKKQKESCKCNCSNHDDNKKMHTYAEEQPGLQVIQDNKHVIYEESNEEINTIYEESNEEINTIYEESNEEINKKQKLYEKIKELDKFYFRP